MSPAEVASSAAFKSCEYIEGGLSFSYRALRPCAIIHHERGQPELLDYRGGPLPLAEIARKRDEIRAANQGDGHPDCRGCPCIEERAWPERRHLIDWLGITHWTLCNIACDYCWLQWSDWSPHNTPEQRAQLYEVGPAIRELIAGGLLAPRAVVDWGGGGEPTIAPEFDELLRLLDAHGTTQWIHTNAVRLPEPIRRRELDSSRLRVVCSVDAGTREQYRSMKGRDHLDLVWENLEAYLAAGAGVTVKYIVGETNHDRRNLDLFVERAFEAGVVAVASDIDYRFPDPPEHILEALAHLHLQCMNAGIHASFTGLGGKYAPELEVEARIGNRVRRRTRQSPARALALVRKALGIGPRSYYFLLRSQALAALGRHEKAARAAGRCVEELAMAGTNNAWIWHYRRQIRRWRELAGASVGRALRLGR